MRSLPHEDLLPLPSARWNLGCVEWGGGGDGDWRLMIAMTIYQYVHHFLLSKTIKRLISHDRTL